MCIHIIFYYVRILIRTSHALASWMASKHLMGLTILPMFAGLDESLICAIDNFIFKSFLLYSQSNYILTNNYGVTSRRPLLAEPSYGNGSRCCLPSWHASHTRSTRFNSKAGSPSTEPFACIPRSRWRFMWPNRLCHNSMFVSVLRLLAYMADFTHSNRDCLSVPWL